MNSEFFDLDGKFEKECRSKGYTYKDYYFYMTSDGQYHHNIPFCSIFKIYLGVTFILFALYGIIEAPCNLLYSDLCTDNWVDEINLQILYNLETMQSDLLRQETKQAFSADFAENYTQNSTQNYTQETNYPFSSQALEYMRNHSCSPGRLTYCFTNATITKYTEYTADFPEFNNYCKWSTVNEKALAKIMANTKKKSKLHENPAHKLEQNSHTCYLIENGCPTLSCNSLPFLLYVFALFAVNAALTYCCCFTGSTIISLVCFWFDDIKNRLANNDSRYMANSSMYDFKTQ